MVGHLADLGIAVLWLLFLAGLAGVLLLSATFLYFVIRDWRTSKEDTT